MYDIEQICAGIIAMLYTLPCECVNWDFVKNVFTSIKDIHYFNSYSIKILIATINNNIKYSYINNIDVGCPGNYAKYIVSHLGMPAFMNKDILNYNLIKICEQLSTEQILNARRNRNWSKFDKMNDLSKLMFRLEELQIYEDIIDPDYIPNL